jgi:hypothetical protein
MGPWGCLNARLSIKAANHHPKDAKGRRRSVLLTRCKYKVSFPKRMNPELSKSTKPGSLGGRRHLLPSEVLKPWVAQPSPCTALTWQNVTGLWDSFPENAHTHMFAYYNKENKLIAMSRQALWGFPTTLSSVFSFQWWQPVWPSAPNTLAQCNPSRLDVNKIMLTIGPESCLSPKHVDHRGSHQNTASDVALGEWGLRASPWVAMLYVAWGHSTHNQTNTVWRHPRCQALCLLLAIHNDRTRTLP